MVRQETEALRNESYNDRVCPVPHCEVHNWDPDEEFGHLLTAHRMPFHMANRIAANHDWHTEAE